METIKILKPGTRIVIPLQDNKNIKGIIKSTIIGFNNQVKYQVGIWSIDNKLLLYDMAEQEFEEAEPFTDNSMGVDYRGSKFDVSVGYEANDVAGKVIFVSTPMDNNTVFKAPHEIFRDLNSIKEVPVEGIHVPIISNPCPNCKTGSMVKRGKLIDDDYLKCDNCDFETDQWTYKNRNVHIRSGKDKGYDEHLITDEDEPEVKKEVITITEEFLIGGLEPEPDYLSSFKWTRYNEDGTPFDPTIAGQKGFWVDQNQYNESDRDLIWVPFKEIQSFSLREASITESGVEVGGIIKANPCPKCGGDKESAFRCGEIDCPFSEENHRDGSVSIGEHPLECKVCGELKDSCTTPGCPNQLQGLIQRDCRVNLKDPDVLCNDEAMHECKMCPKSRDNGDRDYPSA